ncbi:hypothetical protein GGF32_005190 [Allomyces javanicus]|nr:hypothetical protein GGF32_005190 [Allomyces javanicus]
MPTGPNPDAIQVCEPVVLASRDWDQDQPACLLVEALIEARTMLPLSDPTSTLVKSLISVTAKVAEFMRVSGSVPMSVPAATQWHLNLQSHTYLCLWKIQMALKITAKGSPLVSSVPHPLTGTRVAVASAPSTPGTWSDLQ